MELVTLVNLFRCDSDTWAVVSHKDNIIFEGDIEEARAFAAGAPLAVRDFRWDDALIVSC